jgi:RimJ/RimL family protein N-acetyltransferase
MKRTLLIETPSLTLRRFVPADREKVFRMSQEEGMRTWIPSQVYRDEAHAGSVLAFLISQYHTGEDPRTVPIVLGVQLKATGKLVGHVGLSPFDGAVEIGYAIEQAQQRRGFATEAVRAACTWATSEFPIRNILGITAARNIASQGVLLHAGFRHKEERIMQFQGSEQPVLIFEFSAQPAERR